MTPGQILDAVVLLIVVTLLVWGGSKLVSGIQAPAKLDAAIGNNHALKRSVDAQNKGIDALKGVSDAREAKSKMAVENAGKPQLEHAAKILAAPSVGETDYDRAVNRIDRELELK